MIGLPIDALAVGDGAELMRVATEAHVAGFVDAVGDHNPIHSDREYAAATTFGERIAPGIWTAGLISAVIGTRLPGPGTIYLSQDLKFLRPVKLGDAIRARVEVVDVNRERNRVRLRTVCTNQRGEDVLTGEALVMPSRTPVRYEPETAAPWTALPWTWAADGVAAMGELWLLTLSSAMSWWLPRGVK
jgi:acyl dehydratase